MNKIMEYQKIRIQNRARIAVKNDLSKGAFIDVIGRTIGDHAKEYAACCYDDEMDKQGRR